MKQMPESTCLRCGARLDAATGIGCSDPEAGSLSICAKCGAVTAFGDDLRLRPLTVEEVAGIMADPPTMFLLRRATGLIHFMTAGQN